MISTLGGAIYLVDGLPAAADARTPSVQEDAARAPRVSRGQGSAHVGASPSVDAATGGVLASSGGVEDSRGSKCSETTLQQRLHLFACVVVRRR